LEIEQTAPIIDSNVILLKITFVEHDSPAQKDGK